MLMHEYVANLEKMGGGFFERFILDCGKKYKAAPFNGERGTPKECFSNAAHLALSGVGDYVEGIAWRGSLKGVLLIHHAWNVDKRGNVIDSTWDEPEDGEYFGIRFSNKKLLARLNQLQHYGLFYHDEMLDIKYMSQFDKNIYKKIEQRKTLVTKLLGGMK